MTRFVLMLICLSIIAIVYAHFLLGVEPRGGHGEPHPEYSSMSRGADHSRHDGQLAAGWIFGCAQIVLFVLCLSAGIKRCRHRVWLAVGLAQIAVFTALMLSYGWRSGEGEIVLGFTTSSAWLVFGMWPVACLAVILYVLNFRAWVYNDADRLEFQRILAGSESPGVAASPDGESHG